MFEPVPNSLSSHPTQLSNNRPAVKKYEIDSHLISHHHHLSEIRIQTEWKSEKGWNDETLKFTLKEAVKQSQTAST